MKIRIKALGREITTVELGRPLDDLECVPVIAGLLVPFGRYWNGSKSATTRSPRPPDRLPPAHRRPASLGQPIDPETIQAASGAWVATCIACCYIAEPPWWSRTAKVSTLPVGHYEGVNEAGEDRRPGWPGVAMDARAASGGSAFGVLAELVGGGGVVVLKWSGAVHGVRYPGLSG